MAKESMKAREVKRRKLVERYANKRTALKEARDYIGLQKLPKSSISKVRLINDQPLLQVKRHVMA